MTRSRFDGFTGTGAGGRCPQVNGLAFPGNVRVVETIWQPTEVVDGDVEDCQVEDWLPDDLKKSP